MSSFAPERPTLPPLRSLALPMHGVPSRLTLPAIQSVQLLISNTRQSSDTAKLIHRTLMLCIDGRNTFPPPRLCIRRLPCLLHLLQVPSPLRYTIQRPTTHTINIRRIQQNHMSALCSPIRSKTPMPLLSYARQAHQIRPVHPG